MGISLKERKKREKRGLIVKQGTKVKKVKAKDLFKKYQKKQKGN